MYLTKNKINPYIEFDSQYNIVIINDKFSIHKYYLAHSLRLSATADRLKVHPLGIVDIGSIELNVL